MRKNITKPLARLTAGLAMVTMVGTNCFASIPYVEAAPKGEQDLAQEKDVVMMADCPVVKEAVVRNNPKGSHLKVNDGDDATRWTSSAYDDCLHKEHWLYADFIAPKTFDG